ncbi:MAG: type II secretion system F family protein [Acidimicrobiia bacterium]|nr:type II secretion system F family protein [Acidimicrobiia bacterium]
MSLTPTPIEFLAAMVTAVGAGLLARALVPPPRRLHSRLTRYVSPTLSDLSTRGRDVGPLRSIFGPIVADLADLVARLIDRGGAEVTLTKLRQAGWFRNVPEEDRVGSYRVAQLQSIAVGLLSGLAIGQVLSLAPLPRALLLALGVVVGGTRTKAKLEGAIEERREMMKIEIYTINQLLAMRVRAGGGVIQAVRSTVGRGSGEVVSELSEALRLHRSGWRGTDAFRRIAELTPEPFCARTYRLLAAAEERGAELAGALLSLSEDVRETRRESIRRNATKRRAAMLVPTVAILAPVLILFVAAPLPYLITNWQ